MNTIDINAFSNSAFDSASASAPFAQIINPKDEALPWGFCVTLKNATEAGFIPPDKGWKESKIKFGNAEKETVYLSQSPRLLILGVSPLFMKNRPPAPVTPPKLYDKGTYDKASQVLFRRVWCYILDENNQRCHNEPLAIALKGAAGASLMASYLKVNPRSGFIADMEKLYALKVGQPSKPKNHLFHAHCVYEPVLKLEYRGSASSSLVAATKEYVTPTIEKNLIVDTEFSALLIHSVDAVRELNTQFQQRTLKSFIQDLPDDPDQPF